MVFQSTLPVWGATLGRSTPLIPVPYFNPRSPCGERRFLVRHARVQPHISIHAPRVGSDSSCGTAPRGTTYFNPRSPCGERRDQGRSKAHLGRISIHAPRVGSDLRDDRERAVQGDISIHAPRVGSDPTTQSTCKPPKFQSTLPVWGAT